MTTRRTLTVLVPLLTLIGGAAHADRRDPLENQPWIRHKVEMRKARFEITPAFVMSINQDFRHFVGVGIVLQMHITDWLGIGVQGAFGGGIDTGLTGKLADDNGALPVTQTGIQPSRQQFRDHLATINAMFSAYVSVTPFVGKMSMFGALFLKYDLYGMVGLGGMNMTNTYDPALAGNDPKCQNGDPNKCDPLNAGLKVGGMFGVGLHLFFNDWIGINLELRDYLASTNPAGLDVNGDRRVGPTVAGDSNPDDTISNNIFFGAGITLMLPPTAKVSR